MLSWNQTKVGLKVRHRDTVSSALEQLKSDQGGIESWRAGYTGLSWKKKSWNQTKVGLKGLRQSSLFLSTWPVEIRPRWDWKDGCGLVLDMVKFMLKSDQGGIESWWSIAEVISFHRNSWNQTKVGLKDTLRGLPFCLPCLQCWNQTKVGLKGTKTSLTSKSCNSCWNQTKVGLKGEIAKQKIRNFSKLKSDQGGIESHFLYRLDKVPLPFSWNQTKVGLKGRREQQMKKLNTLVEIRPRWDWKLSRDKWDYQLSSLLKSDQDGIERVF